MAEKFEKRQSIFFKRILWKNH